MRALLSSCAVCLLTATAISCGSPSDGPRESGDVPLAIVGVTIVDVETGQLLPERTVLIEGPRIKEVRSSVNPQAATRVVDGRGKFLIPGLWDMHVHAVRLGEQSLSIFLAYGVTGIRDLGSPEAIYAWRDEVARGARLGPRMYVAGRVITESEEERPSFNGQGVSSVDGARAAVRQRRRDGANLVKVADAFMRRDLWLAIADEASAQGLPLISHFPVDVTLPEAVAHGLRGIEHTLGVPLALTTSETRIRQSVMRSEGADARWSTSLEADLEANAAQGPNRLAAVAALLRSHAVSVTPTLTDSRAMASATSGRWDNDERLRLLSPANRARWRANLSAPDLAPANTAALQRLFARAPSLVRDLQSAGVQILAGTDAAATFDFPGSDLHSELALLGEAGLPPLEALRAATLNAARVLGLADSLGSIAPGKLADLVLIDQNPLEDIRNTSQVFAVVANGQYFERSALDRLLADVERAYSSSAQQ